MSVMLKDNGFDIKWGGRPLQVASNNELLYYPEEDIYFPSTAESYNKVSDGTYTTGGWTSDNGSYIIAFDNVVNFASNSSYH